ncbi:MAG: VanZ family protein [Eubacterium sp.]|jgi:VanZ family protein|nr:VanZ family protein [Eubacterium sp.]
MRKSYLGVLIVFWSFTFGWLCLAWFLSSQTGEASGRLSSQLAAAISRLFGLAPDNVNKIESVLRTAAHFGVFCILSVLATISSTKTFRKHNHAWLWPLPVNISVAVIDEIRKSAIPGRHTSYGEAMINVLGCVSGALAVWLAARFLTRRKIIS